MKHAKQAYILCSNPRSGTTLLCDLLSQTGIAGRPNSFFREKSLEDWCEDWGVDGPIDLNNREFSDRYFRAMYQEGLGGTATFGLRLMGPDLRLACDWTRRYFPETKSDLAAFKAMFGEVRFIHLVREDKLAEAVSYIRAEQTGLWHGLPDGTALEEMPIERPDGYDEQAITERMENLREFDVAWERWFREQGITPLRITYDALSKAPQNVLGDVLSFVGLEPSCAKDIRPGVRKLADATNAVWIKRYRARHPDR
ncbi:MAG: Stf0 family sulfotransferase [Sulfitobacter sp.]